jgi:hypothetical protein
LQAKAEQERAALQAKAEQEKAVDLKNTVQAMREQGIPVSVICLITRPFKLEMHKKNSRRFLKNLFVSFC